VSFVRYAGHCSLNGCADRERMRRRNWMSERGSLGDM
jgi:hypothetical protein